jgi:hypothetical protein
MLWLRRRRRGCWCGRGLCGCLRKRWRFLREAHSAQQIIGQSIYAYICIYFARIEKIGKAFPIFSFIITIIHFLCQKVSLA